MASGNDACVTMAEYIAGSEPGTIDEPNGQTLRHDPLTLLIQRDYLTRNIFLPRTI